ncbi:MAG TPA: hypothetical protein VFY98_10440 [Intrasporangium sp.]|nr:hypothetical protein [Intrasporangium sp.]
MSPPQTKHGFGWGAASMTSPAPATGLSGKVKVTAGGPPKGSASKVEAKLQRRVARAANETTGWTDAAARQSR